MAAPRLLLGLFALVLLAPLAAASSAQGTLQVAGEARAPGASTLDAARGDLLWNQTSVPTVTLAGDAITVERYGQQWMAQDTPIGLVSVQPPTQVSESKSFGAGSITLEKGNAAQTLALAASGPVTVALTDATVRPAQGVLLARVLDASHVDDDSNGACHSERCLDAHGVYELATSASTATFAPGDITILLHGPSLVVSADGAQTRFASGDAKSGQAPTQSTEETWAIVHVKNAHGTLAAPGAARWYAPAPQLAATSAVADAVTGDVDVGLKAYRAAAEPLDLAGAFTLALDAVAPGDWGTGSPTHVGSGDATPTSYAGGFTAHVQGDVTSINLHAKPVYQQPPAETLGAAAVIAAAGAALAYYWPLLSFHATAAALPLYTRLKQPEILANEVRNTIYEIIRAHPGISAREVHRQSDQSWGTVVYHLRQLERHHLVVSRSVGRTRNYYENHGKYRGMEIQLACLQAPRARALARIVLDAPGISQEDLVMKSGYPQPTTSYYVRKLKMSALVEERREGRYARYHPMPDLARFLQLAEAAPAPTVGLAPATVEG